MTDRNEEPAPGADAAADPAPGPEPAGEEERAPAPRPRPKPRPVVPPEARERIRAAVEAVGSGEPGDYVLAPRDHAERYRAAAPELADLLEWREVQGSARAFEECDQSAVAAQKSFFAAASRARTWVLVAGLVAAGLLAVGALAGQRAGTDEVARWVILALSLAGVLAAGVASVQIQRISTGEMLKRWMGARAEAETERLGYFELVTHPAGLGEPLLQLEYFRRYQLDVQLAFFRRRAADQRRDADRALSRATAAMGVGAVASAAAGLLSVKLGAHWSALAAVGLTAQAVTAWVENQEATAQWRRNAERYERTYRVLDRIEREVDRVRAAVAEGDLEVMREFVAAVHTQLSSEHNQWLNDAVLGGKAVARLDELLKEYDRAPSRPDDG